MDTLGVYKKKIRQRIMKVSLSIMVFFAIYVFVAVVLIVVFLFTSPATCFKGAFSKFHGALKTNPPIVSEPAIRVNKK